MIITAWSKCIANSYCENSCNKGAIMTIMAIKGKTVCSSNSDVAITGRSICSVNSYWDNNDNNGELYM